MTPIPAHNSVINYTDNLTKDTIRKVATLAGQFSFDSYVDELAETCTQGTGEKDLVGEISAAFYCVQNRVEWHRDPITGEKIYQPPLLARRVLKFVNGYVAYPPKGDCDDKACLLMCLLLNRGHAARAVGAWQSLIPPYQGCPDPQIRRTRNGSASIMSTSRSRTRAGSGSWMEVPYSGPAAGCRWSRRPKVCRRSSRTRP